MRRKLKIKKILNYKLYLIKMIKKILCCFLFLHLIASIFIFAFIISNIKDPYNDNHSLQETVKVVFNNQIQPPLKEIRISRGVIIFFFIYKFMSKKMKNKKKYI